MYHAGTNLIHALGQSSPATDLEEKKNEEGREKGGLSDMIGRLLYGGNRRYCLFLFKRCVFRGGK